MTKNVLFKEAHLQMSQFVSVNEIISSCAPQQKQQREQGRSLDVFQRKLPFEIFWGDHHILEFISNFPVCNHIAVIKPFILL